MKGVTLLQAIGSNPVWVFKLVEPCTLTYHRPEGMEVQFAEQCWHAGTVRISERIEAQSSLAIHHAGDRSPRPASCDSPARIDFCPPARTRVCSCTPGLLASSPPPAAFTQVRGGFLLAT